MEKEKKIKVLIATGIYPPEIGGPSTMIEALVNSLGQIGFDFKIITYYKGDKDRSSDSIYRIKSGQSFSYLKYLWTITAQSFWADIIYATDTYSVGYFAYLMKRIFKKKYIVRFVGDSAWEAATANGWTTDYIVEFQNKKYDARIEKLKARRKTVLVNADGVITVSDFLVMIAEKIGVKKGDIRIFYNSVDFVKKDKIDSQKILSIKEKYGQNSKIVSTACRLTPWKGVDGIIGILPELIKKIGNVNLLVLGDGQEKENLLKLAADKGVDKNVFFLGSIVHSEVLDHFRASDLFVLNSNYEGLSHTILEAMEAGTPVVASRSGGNPETIADGKEGILVDYNNHDQLLEACAKILSDKDLSDRFVNNAKLKLKIFSWDNVVKNTKEFLTNIVNE